MQHLAAVGRALLGEDKDQPKGWLRPLVRQFKRQSSLKVIRQLEEILAGLPAGAAAAAVQKEVNYFHDHQNRMDCRAGQQRGEPIGSGAIESTCRPATYHHALDSRAGKHRDCANQSEKQAAILRTQIRIKKLTMGPGRKLSPRLCARS